MANDDFGFDALQSAPSSDSGDEFGFESLSHPDLKNVAEPSRTIPTQYKGNFSPVGALSAIGGGLVGSIAGGYRGLYDIATGKSMEQAAQDVEATQQATTPEINQATSDVLGSKYNPLNWPGMVAKKAGEGLQDLGVSPGAATAAETGINALTMGLGGGALRGATAVADVTKAVRSADQALQGTGKTFQSLSPELQTKVINDSVKGEIRPEVLRAQADADGITSLTEGQATGNKDVFAMEREIAKRSGKDNPPVGAPEAAAKFKQQNEDLANYFDNKIGAGTAMSPADAGQSTLLKMAETDKAYKDAISKAYDAVKDSNGRSAKLNTEDFYMKAESAMEQALGGSRARDFIPKEILNLYDDYTSGKIPLTVDSMTAFDKILSRAARSTTDANAEFGINTIRRALNDTEITGDSGPAAAQMYKQARMMARNRFALADPTSQTYVPAYAAMLKGMGKDSHEAFVAALDNGTANVDSGAWFKNNVANASPSNIKKLTSLLEQVGAQDQISILNQGVLSTLRDKVIKGNTDIANRGSLSADDLSKAIKDRGASYAQLLTPEQMSDLGKLSRTATRIQRLPEGAPVNFSNTSAALDNLGQVAGNYGKKAAAVGAHFLGGPVGHAVAEGAMTLSDVALKGRKAKAALKEVDKTLNPPVTSEIPKSRGQKLSDLVRKTGGSYALGAAPLSQPISEGQ